MAGKGCFICELKTSLKRHVRLEMLTREIDEAVVAAHHLQIPREAFMELMRDRFDVFEKRRADSDKTAAKD